MHDLPQLLKRAHFAVRHALDNALAKYGLTSAQLDILIRVGNHTCIEHRALLDEVGVSSPTLTRLVDTLVESGFIARQISEDDSRVKELSMTEMGRTLRERLMEDYPAFSAQLGAGFSPAEMLMLNELLSRLIANAEDITE